MTACATTVSPPGYRAPRLVRIIDSIASSPIPAVNGLAGCCAGCDSVLASFEAPAPIQFASQPAPSTQIKLARHDSYRTATLARKLPKAMSALAEAPG